MNEELFANGSAIYREGDQSDAVYVIRRGKVNVLRDADGKSVLLGVLREGDIFGEMGVIQDKPRSTTMRALSGVTVLRLPKTVFLSAFGGDNSLGLPLLRMLCERLARADDRLIEDASPDIETAHMAEVGKISVFAASPSVERQIGKNGVVISTLPFRVGRRVTRHHKSDVTRSELSLKLHDDLTISPQHFALEEQDGVLIVRDLDSYLGTIVNSDPVSRFGSAKTAPLLFGINLVVAGGIESPYRFRVVVERVHRS